MNDIEIEVDRIVASGALGRSPVYGKLLRYLAAASAHARSPKEADIAVDVLAKSTFDSATDSSVRVYIHNLRQKLESHYGTDGVSPELRLVIPKGKYQLVAEEVTDPIKEATGTSVSNRSPAYIVAVVGVLATLMLAAFLVGRSMSQEKAASPPWVAASPIWGAFLDNDYPVQIVVGDYFIFAEGGRDAPGGRLIRDFSINSSADFAAWRSLHPELASQFSDINLHYLPTGIAYALNNVLAILYRAGQSVRVVPQSQFRANALRSRDIIYVGYVSGLGQLERYLFDGSRLLVGSTYDELVDRETGDRFISSAGYVTDAGQEYIDYGLVSTVPGPVGNQFLFIAGLRDEGLMQMTALLSNSADASQLGAEVTVESESGPAFEALYKVNGTHRTFLASRQIFLEPVNTTRLWDEPSP